MRFAVVLALGILVPYAAIADDVAPKKVDQIFSVYEKADSPGCSLGVISEGDLFTARLTVRQISNLEFRFRRSLFSTWVRYRSSLPPLPWCWRQSGDSFRWTTMCGNTFRSLPITVMPSRFASFLPTVADLHTSLP